MIFNIAVNEWGVKKKDMALGDLAHYDNNFDGVALNCTGIE
jgi:hypothetical protein